MEPNDWLAQEFEGHRAHLHAVASRLLASRADADDAVQEAWLRVSGADVSSVDNLGGWLTTVVSRVSIDMLRSRAARPSEKWDESAHDAMVPDPSHRHPEAEAELADTVGAALLVVLETCLRPNGSRSCSTTHSPSRSRR